MIIRMMLVAPFFPVTNATKNFFLPLLELLISEWLRKYMAVRFVIQNLVVCCLIFQICFLRVKLLKKLLSLILELLRSLDKIVLVGVKLVLVVF